RTDHGASQPGSRVGAIDVLHHRCSLSGSRRVAARPLDRQPVRPDNAPHERAAASESWAPHGGTPPERQRGERAGMSVEDLTPATESGSLFSNSVEINGINVIAESERKGKPSGLFWPWFGANVSVFGISYGAFIL